MQLRKLGIYTFIYPKKPKNCDFDRSKVSKTPPLHTYAPQSIQITTATEAKKKSWDGYNFGGGSDPIFTQRL